MKKRKINLTKIIILFCGLFFISLLQNCENDFENTTYKYENPQNLNLKTVSFEKAKKVFNQKNSKMRNSKQKMKILLNLHLIGIA